MPALRKDPISSDSGVIICLRDRASVARLSPGKRTVRPRSIPFSRERYENSPRDCLGLTGARRRHGPPSPSVSRTGVFPQSFPLGGLRSAQQTWRPASMTWMNAWVPTRLFIVVSALWSNRCAAQRRQHPRISGGSYRSMRGLVDCGRNGRPGHVVSAARDIAN